MDFKEKYFSDYMAAYELHKKFFDMSGTDQEWESLINEAKKLYSQFEDKPFAKSLVRAILDEFEKVCKERKENE